MAKSGTGRGRKGWKVGVLPPSEGKDPGVPLINLMGLSEGRAGISSRLHAFLPGEGAGARRKPEASGTICSKPFIHELSPFAVQDMVFSCLSLSLSCIFCTTCVL